MVPEVSLSDKVRIVSATVVQRYPIVVVVEMAWKCRLRITRAIGDREFPGKGIMISGRDFTKPLKPCRSAADRPATRPPGWLRTAAVNRCSHVAGEEATA
jgi:hypothetical protein